MHTVTAAAVLGADPASVGWQRTYGGVTKRVDSNHAFLIQRRNLIMGRPTTTNAQ
jgi:hypothetical protein